MPLSELRRDPVTQAKRFWRANGSPDANEFLSAHPELVRTKSLVINLAYEEFYQRVKNGEVLDQAQFCKRFPSFGISLLTRLSVDSFVDFNKDLVEKFPLSRWPAEGEAICGFALVEELGRGSIGRAFLAEELSLADRDVVVKLTPAGLQEAETLGSLKHPHIVPVYSVHKDDDTGLTVIVMPYSGRATLQDFLDAVEEAGHRPASFGPVMNEVNRATDPNLELATDSASTDDRDYVEGVVRMAISLAGALAHAHDLGVYHLDMKPSNVLLTPAGEPMLLDFNLSIAGAATSSLVGGTMPFMSPEQVRALVLEDKEAFDSIDRRSDIYSLGLMIHHLLCGKYPFADMKWDAPARKIAVSLLDAQRAGPPLASQLEADIPREVALVLRRAVAFEPSDRFASITELAQALEQCYSPARKLQRKALRHRRKFLLAGLGAAAAAISGGVWLATSEPYEKRLRRQAWEQFADGKNEAALASFDALVELDDQDADAYFGRGRARQRLGEYMTTLHDFEVASKLSPDEGKYWACMGFCCNVAGSHGLAAEYYSLAQQKGFISAEMLCSWGFSLTFTGRPAEAIPVLERSIRLDGDSAVAHHTLACAQLKCQLPDLADESEMQAIELAPDVAHYHAMASWAFKLSGNAEAAVERFQSAVQLGFGDEPAKSLPIYDVLPRDPRLDAAFDLPRQVGIMPEFLDPLGDESISLRTMPGQQAAAPNR